MGLKQVMGSRTERWVYASGGICSSCLRVNPNQRLAWKSHCALLFCVPVYRVSLSARAPTGTGKLLGADPMLRAADELALTMPQCAAGCVDACSGSWRARHIRSGAGQRGHSTATAAGAASSAAGRRGPCSIKRPEPARAAEGQAERRRRDDAPSCGRAGSHSPVCQEGETSLYTDAWIARSTVCLW